MELEIENLDSIGTWELGTDGMINQTLSDLQDADIRLFTESARTHNQKIQDAKNLAVAG